MHAHPAKIPYILKRLINDENINFISIFISQILNSDDIIFIVTEMKVKIIAFMVFLISGEKILTHEESIQRHNNVLSSKFPISFIRRLY